MLPFEDLAGKKIVCVGDSLTAAEGVRPEEGFPALLARALKTATVLAQGRSGWPTTAYLRRMDEVLSALPADADLILLQLGANDLRVEGHSDATVARTARRLEQIIDRFRTHAPAAEIVLLAPPTMFPADLTPRLRTAGFGKHSPRFLAALGAAFRALATEKRCGFIDLFDALGPGETLDGAHPDPAGHGRLARHILRRLTSRRP